MEYSITEVQLGILIGLSKFKDREEYAKKNILLKPILNEGIVINGYYFIKYQVERIKELLYRSGGIVDAIRYIREDLKPGMSLKDAKDITDSLRKTI